MKKFSKEIKIALAAIAGIVLLFFGLNFLKGITLFSSDNSYKMTFKDVSGLTPSSPIYADGYKVGVVRSIDYDYTHPGEIAVAVDINKNMQIPLGSSAEIVSDLLGNVQINLLLAKETQKNIMPGGTIVGAINSGAMGQMKDMIPIIEKMLPKIDSIMAHLNGLLGDPVVKQTLYNAQDITASLNHSSQELNAILATLNKNMPGLLHQTDSVLTNTRQFTGRLAQIDVQTTMNKVEKTLQNVQQLTDKINSKDGTFGLMLNDPSLYHSLTATVRSADSLVTNLKEHPKRYVHFSVFGKKDK